MKLPFYIHTKDPMSKRWRIVGILLVLVCLIFTLGLWYTLEENNTTIAANRLTADKEVVLDTMERRLEVYSDVLYGGRALFLINPDLTRDDWDTYMESQNLQQRYPGLNSVAYLTVTDREGLDEVFESINEQRRDGEPEVEPLFQTNTDQFAIGTYATRINGFQVLGRNAYDRDYFRDTLDTAAVSGVPVASPPFMSPNPAREGTMDLLIVLPVYNRTFQNNMTDSEKRAALQGFVTASIHPETLFELGVSSLNDPKTVAVLVQTAEGLTVYDYGSNLNGNRIGLKSDMNVAGQQWSITLSAPATYDLTIRQVYAPLFFLVAGIVFMVIIVNLYFYWTGIRFSRRKPTPTQSE